MMGYYAPEAVRGKKKGGKIMPLFSDSVYTEKDDRVEVERRMMVGKQPIIVRSFFVAEAAKTPTQKLLNIIENDTERMTM